MIVTRFAPSPTGYLHLGHDFAAAKAFAARGSQGDFLLRIEDIDSARCRPEVDAAIFEDLRWLGLDWETSVRRQSEHFGDYGAALKTLDAKGVLYPCFCTRKDIAEEIARASGAPHGPDGPLYPGTCRGLNAYMREVRIAAGEAYALRLDIAKATAPLARSLTFEERGEGPNGEHGLQIVQPALFGDVVLARKDSLASYHLAVVVDDALQGVTLVTRGNDLFAAAYVQRLLQELLGLPAPAYAHHRLILAPDGKKFSKRDAAVTLRSLREAGHTPQDIFRQIGA